MVLGEGPNWSRRVPIKKFKICDPPFYKCFKYQIGTKGFSLNNVLPISQKQKQFEELAIRKKNAEYVHYTFKL